MDRRDFFKNVLSASLLTPLFIGSKPAKENSELFLISDNSHRVVPTLLEELTGVGLIKGKSFDFLSVHPEAEEIKKSLVHSGWKPLPSSSPADISIAFRLLHHPVPPSFTLIKEGQIVEIRTHRLLALWTEINRNERPSSCLTTLSMAKVRPRLQPGVFATISLQGKTVDKISLERDIQKTYLTKNGNLSVVVKSGKAEVASSSCPQKVCVSSPPVSLAGERIICVPNHFLLQIEGPHLFDTIIG
ncbi:MAG: NusG domain II-containing protein [Candidatus Aminicenantales bacterium]